MHIAFVSSCWYVYNMLDHQEEYTGDYSSLLGIATSKQYLPEIEKPGLLTLQWKGCYCHPFHILHIGILWNHLFSGFCKNRSVFFRRLTSWCGILVAARRRPLSPSGAQVRSRLTIQIRSRFCLGLVQVWSKFGPGLVQVRTRFV